MAKINTKNLSEEDIKNRYITPALNDAGWKPDMMLMEHYYTDGRIMVQGAFKYRKKGRFVDYLLFVDKNYPIAIVEAKDNNHSSSDGIQQAIKYAKDLDVCFAYSSNGDEFVEHDLTTGLERHFPMSDFPSPDELIKRIDEAKKFTTEEKELIQEPYYSDTEIFPPRYYQRIAINKTIEAIARGQKRLLLVMATGTGKTFTAFHIIHRLHNSHKAKKILYLADRNILIDQTMQKDFKPFRKFMTKIQGKSPDGAYELFMSLYGQWVKNADELKEGERQPYENYSPEFFDLIVVDECHRSSINEDKEWHKILEYFHSAIQIGLTATPKAAEGANNIEYFGKPIFEYSLSQGIEDGFLAPYRVTKSFLNIDLEGYEPEEGEKDLMEKLIEEDFFTRNNFGRSLNIQKRQIIVAKRITEMLKQVGPMTKTIVFCPDQEEAGIMRSLLIELNQEQVRKHPNYVVRITSDDRVGKALLDDFIDPYTPYPVIATTSELLTTGVDCKTCGLIVIDKEVGSMTTFKQMIGRGTRVFKKTNKLNFDILDFRDVTSKFNDPTFDGDADTTTYHPVPPKTGTNHTPGDDNDNTSGGEEEEKTRKYYVEGKEVKIVHEQVLYLGEDGRTLKTEKLTDFTRRGVLKSYPSLDAFRGAWKNADKKQAILDELQENDIIIDAIIEENPSLRECDPFDIICHLAFDQKPLTRKERLEGVKKRNYLAKYEGKARQVIEGLMEKYGEVGITNIENTQILNLNPFTQIAKRPRIIKGVFRGPEDYNNAVRELEEQLYMEG